MNRPRITSNIRAGMSRENIYARIRQLVRAGNCPKQIASALGYTHQHVYQVMQAAGIRSELLTETEWASIRQQRANAGRVSA